MNWMMINRRSQQICQVDQIDLLIQVKLWFNVLAIFKCSFYLLKLCMLIISQTGS
jgi:hypothetical protein